MAAFQPPPRVWLVSDERQGEWLLPALDRLPDEAGILFRHYSLAAEARRALFDQVAARAKGRALRLFLAGSAQQAAAWGADGWHGRGTGKGLHSAPVHDRAEIMRAEGDGAALLFLSPVYPTRSHPGAPTLGPARFLELAVSTPLPVIALGGITLKRGAELMRRGAYGWAGVDAWTA